MANLSTDIHKEEDDNKVEKKRKASKGPRYENDDAADSLGGQGVVIGHDSNESKKKKCDEEKAKPEETEKAATDANSKVHLMKKAIDFIKQCENDRGLKVVDAVLVDRDPEARKYSFTKGYYWMSKKLIDNSPEDSFWHELARSPETFELGEGCMDEGCADECYSYSFDEIRDSDTYEEVVAAFSDPSNNDVVSEFCEGHFFTFESDRFMKLGDKMVDFCGTEAWETDMESESGEEKAFRLLECGEEELYFMIQHRSSSTARGVVNDLKFLTKEEERDLLVIEANLDCRYQVDQTFAKQLVEDSSFMEAIRELRKGNEKGMKSYVHSLNSMFENRFRYLSSLRHWTKLRLNLLGMKTEREELLKFFDSEAIRFGASIPPIEAFEIWIDLIYDVRSLHEIDVSELAEKGQAKAGDNTVVEKNLAEKTTNDGW